MNRRSNGRAAGKLPSFEARSALRDARKKDARKQRQIAADRDWQRQKAIPRNAAWLAANDLPERERHRRRASDS